MNVNRWYAVQELTEAINQRLTLTVIVDWSVVSMQHFLHHLPGTVAAELLAMSSKHCPTVILDDGTVSMGRHAGNGQW